MTFGFSRDDVESRMMPAYLEQGCSSATRSRRSTRPASASSCASAPSGAGRPSPKLKLGVCGEHGGDPESIALFYDAGLDYVSCSPFRVPIARLGAAQAIVGAGARSDTSDPPTVIGVDDRRRSPRKATGTSSTSTSSRGSGRCCSASSSCCSSSTCSSFHREAHEVSARRRRRSSRRCGSRSASASRSSSGGGSAARRRRRVHLRLPHREEPQRRQRLRLGADPELLRGAAKYQHRVLFWGIFGALVCGPSSSSPASP